MAIIAFSLCVAALFFWIMERNKRKAVQFLLELEQKKGARAAELEALLVDKEEQITAYKIRQSVSDEKLQVVRQAHESLSQTFKALSLEALDKNSQSFLTLAQATLEKFQETAKGDLEKKQQSILELVNPVKESLSKMDLSMRQMEKERKGDQQQLHEQVRSLLETERQLRHETGNLVKALRSPITRGRWGEMQLKRVVELAGMINHCDFFEQTLDTADEEWLKPDMIVRLPGGRQVIIDAKAPLEAYLDAVQMQDETSKEIKLKDHARQVRQHVMALSKKGYWQRFTPTPEFVILFLPSETFFSAALEFDPALLEIGVEEGVILATPTTLIALLRAVAYGWKQEVLSKHVAQVQELGEDLYKRIADMSSHFAKMGRSLAGAVEAYNKGIGSLESRVLVSARKFKELGASASLEAEEIPLVEKSPRSLQVSHD